MEQYNFKIKAVLEKELFSNPPLMPVVIAKLIGSNRDIPRAFRLTKEATADLRHLRRVRESAENGIECIIACLAPRDRHEEELKRYEKKFSDENIFQDYSVAWVPSKAPKTEHQRKSCANIWPCKFARSHYLIRCMEGSIFTETERLALKIVITNTLRYIEAKQDSYKSAATVFRCAKVYGIGLSNPEIIESNPTKHSTMLAIDSVATNAGAGHWKCSNGLKLMEDIQNQFDTQDELKDHRVDVHFLPYLCTNYDIFVTEEPCIMCTMGLVQSRIRRLFYLDSESIDKLTKCQPLCHPDKAIESFLIHRDKSLNHRFEAWKITLIPGSEKVIETVQSDT